MKTLIITLPFAFILFLSSFHSVAFAAAKKPPHYEMDLQGSDYAKILAKRRRILSTVLDADESKLKPVLDLGQRNLQFLVFINSQRDDAHKISLTSEATEPASPIQSPKRYNAAIAYQAYEDLLKEMPKDLASVLLSHDPFPTNPPMPDAEYIHWGLKADQVYQTAARWLTLKPYLRYYKEAAHTDLRGFYYLQHEEKLAAKLEHWHDLEPQYRAQLQSWLLGMCFNSVALETCKQELRDILRTHTPVAEFYQKYAPLSQKQYDEFFKLAWPRTDITFSANRPEVLEIPFVDPENREVLNYLKDNIEDEWQWDRWNLRMIFNHGNPETTAHIRWETGVTPHVEDANTIVMDENQPMSEYESQWTIRHEFGHILGFPDCYIEFYDEAAAVMTSYQLDITNLMCSRRGHLKQTHVDELRRVYLK